MMNRFQRHACDCVSWAASAGHERTCVCVASSTYTTTVSFGVRPPCNLRMMRSKHRFLLVGGVRQIPAPHVHAHHLPGHSPRIRSTWRYVTARYVLRHTLRSAPSSLSTGHTIGSPCARRCLASSPLAREETLQQQSIRGVHEMIYRLENGVEWRQSPMWSAPLAAKCTCCRSC